MKKLLIALLLATSPAQAAQATWFTSKHWTVTGDTVEKTCIATTTYPQGTGLMIGFTGEYASLTFFGFNVTPGAIYSYYLTTDKGGRGLFHFEGLQNGLGVFAGGLNLSAVWQLANSNYVTVNGVNYWLIGSKEAMREAWECSKAMQGQEL